MKRTADGTSPLGVPYCELTLKIDEPAMEWLERESERTELSVESIATALLRSSCYDETQVVVA